MLTPATESPTGPPAETGTVRVCPACGGSDARIVLTVRGKRYQVAACDLCQFRFTRPLPSAQELSALYPAVYYQEGCSSGWMRLKGILHSVVIRDRVRTLRGKRPGRILDVGCGDADFLHVLRSRGWEVVATDTSAAAAALAASKGIEVHHGELPAAHFPQRSFDAVTLWHVLEHVPDPRQLLREIRRILKDDGLLVAEVPNSDCWTAGLTGEDWFPLDVPRHLQHFTAATLRAMLMSEGFEVVRRHDAHWTDPVLAALSFVNRMHLVPPSTDSPYFFERFGSLSPLRKIAVIAAALAAAALAVPYWILALLLSGQSEIVTVVAQKTGRG